MDISTMTTEELTRQIARGDHAEVAVIINNSAATPVDPWAIAHGTLVRNAIADAITTP